MLCVLFMCAWKKHSFLCTELLLYDDKQWCPIEPNNNFDKIISLICVCKKQIKWSSLITLGILRIKYKFSIFHIYRFEKYSKFQEWKEKKKYTIHVCCALSRSKFLKIVFQWKSILAWFRSVLDARSNDIN